MRFILVSLAVLMLGTTASGQPFTVGTPIKVLNFNEIYATYAWEENTRQIISEGFGTQTDDIVKNSSEAGWPVGIASLDARSRNKEQMYDYTLFFLAMMNDHVAILFAPQVENSFMPEDMRPADDIFFIINVHAIEEESTEFSAPITLGFAAQLDEITQDFRNGFANVTNHALEEDKDRMVIYYGTLVPLDGMEEIYFIEDLMSASMIFRAGFPGHTDPAVALPAYRELVRKVEALTLTCCPLAKNEEETTGNSRRQIFRAYDPKGKLDVAYQNMVIEVILERGETFDNEGQILDYWMPVLYVYGM